LVGKESVESLGKTGEGLLGGHRGGGGNRTLEMVGEVDANEEEHLKQVKQEMLQNLADERYVEIVLGFVAGCEEILRMHRGT
jgi:hypothetical protein